MSIAWVDEDDCVADEDDDDDDETGVAVAVVVSIGGSIWCDGVGARDGDDDVDDAEGVDDVDDGDNRSCNNVLASGSAVGSVENTFSGCLHCGSSMPDGWKKRMKVSQFCDITQSPTCPAALVLSEPARCDDPSEDEYEDDDDDDDEDEDEDERERVAAVWDATRDADADAARFCECLRIGDAIECFELDAFPLLRECMDNKVRS